MLQVMVKHSFFISYFLNFILELSFNSEKRDRHFCIQIGEFFRFVGWII